MISGFQEIVLADFEFHSGPGENPEPICLVAHELSSARDHRYAREDLARMQAAPYPTGPDTLFVAYYASAEIGCHLALNWSAPSNVLDLFAEFRTLTNGREPPCGNSLLGALVYHGLDSMASAEKDEMRALAIRGDPFTAEEMCDLLRYCAADVFALRQLLDRMSSQIDWPRALLRGRFMRAAAYIERLGIPVDTEFLATLRKHWPNIKGRLIKCIDAEFQVFENDKFRAHQWALWLARQEIPWPRLPSGALRLDDATFGEAARAFPAVRQIRELRHSLSQLHLEDLAVGSDGRNRCLLSAFRAKTGRNQPSNSKFIFGPSVWLRGLIQPRPGYGIAYVDWSQQEFGIGAALSGDAAMIRAYESGDPYLGFAVQAGAVPVDATKEAHGRERELFKVCALAVQYAMGEDSLSQRIGQSPVHARELLRLHHETREYRYLMVGLSCRQAGSFSSGQIQAVADEFQED